MNKINCKGTAKISSINMSVQNSAEVENQMSLHTLQLCARCGIVEVLQFYTFLCFPLSLPSVPKTQHVLYRRSPERSGIDPPTIVIPRLQAASESMENDGAASPPASISSAYTGKLSFEYGLFHIS